MKLEDMRALYEKTMGVIPKSDDDRYALRVWDGMDGCWCAVHATCDLAFALRAWCIQTSDGTKATRFEHIDYYRIFPANTRMLWSGGNTMFDEDDT